MRKRIKSSSEFLVRRIFLNKNVRFVHLLNQQYGVMIDWQTYRMLFNVTLEHSLIQRVANLLRPSLLVDQVRIVYRAMHTCWNRNSVFRLVSRLPPYTTAFNNKQGVPILPRISTDQLIDTAQNTVKCIVIPVVEHSCNPPIFLPGFEWLMPGF